MRDVGRMNKPLATARYLFPTTHRKRAPAIGAGWPLTRKFSAYFASANPSSEFEQVAQRRLRKGVDSPSVRPARRIAAQYADVRRWRRSFRDRTWQLLAATYTLAWTTMTEPIALVVGAVVGGLFGTIGALLTYRAAERGRADALLSSALEFMGGGSQRRNLGIAAISLYWRQFPQHRQLCAEMLVGAAIYLLSESKQEDASHEVFNLHRIFELLLEIEPTLKKRDAYQRLRDAVEKRLSPFEPKPKIGLWLERSELEKWRDDLKRVAR